MLDGLLPSNLGLRYPDFKFGVMGSAFLMGVEQQGVYGSAIRSTRVEVV